MGIMAWTALNMMILFKISLSTLPDVCLKKVYNLTKVESGSNALTPDIYHIHSLRDKHELKGDAVY
jgi:hypothetical protein